jgi:hypothetical protein
MGKIKTDTPAPRTTASITTELHAAEAKLATRERTKADADARVTAIKAETEALRPDAADGDVGARQRLTAARGTLFDAIDDCETARVGVERAAADVDRLSKDLAEARAVDTAAEYERSKVRRVDAAAGVDDALAVVVSKVHAFAREVDRSRQLGQGREPEPKARIFGAVAWALVNGLNFDVPLPHHSWRGSLADIERVAVGLAESPAILAQRAADQGAIEEAIRRAPVVASRERERAIGRHRLRIARLSPSEAIAERRLLRQLQLEDGQDATVVTE